MVEAEYETHRQLALRRILSEVGGFLYVWWWAKRAAIRSLLEKLAVVFLGGFLLLLVVEILLEENGRVWWTHASTVLRVVFFFVVGLVLYAKLREFRDHGRQLYFVGAAKQITQLLARDHQETPAEELIHRLLAIVHGSSQGNAAAKVALLRGEWLEVAYRYPPIDIPNETRLLLGHGGAGYACQEQCLVYIPRTTLRHGIRQDLEDPKPWRMVADVYEHVGPRDYQSILSVPILVHGQCWGVLNIDSSRPNAFRRLDFEQAMFYGFALALILQRYGDGK